MSAARWMFFCYCMGVATGLLIGAFGESVLRKASSAEHGPRAALAGAPAVQEGGDHA